MTKMMAYIAEKTEFKGNPMDHTLINTFTGK
jgi:PII-like signaling protein